MMNITTVLDHGRIELIQHWGSDELIVESARMSTNKGFKGWDADEKFLKFLWDNNHHTPFEMAGAIFEIKAPIFVFREWHRHRTQSYNEMSARYVPLPDENYVPSIERITEAVAKAKTSRNVQETGIASQGEIVEPRMLQDVIALSHSRTEKIYQSLLNDGLPKELARVVLPVGRYSKMRAGANLRNWLAFLKLRQADNAQWEIRQYADAMAAILADKFPRTMENFNRL